ncbi:hypothetical protein GDO86_017710 [Hymenochirus boettgeri]|uniref:Olfactory receptor n=1 Tax=Hymenochirus boettgeri TaxID=247094 RepID=A0A8T2ISV1_9PIPI|nr:hypothetical protein GDO86_017710 [Hymenochirus boettgeri]
MVQGNFTSVKIFILLGFAHLPQFQVFLIVTFIFLYACTLLGNGLIVLLIVKDHRLHTPMYFFLVNLSIMDLLFSSVTAPKMIRDLICGDGHISVAGCLTQLFFLIIFAASESPLLSAMAFDRYVAICNPLQYKLIMNYKLCFRLTSVSWLLGCLCSFLHTVATSNINFCGPNKINHVFCDILPLMQLACSDITINVAFVYMSAIFNGICNFSVIIVSYTSIVTAIIKIKSHGGRWKAFSTCASHLVVVSVYYVTLLATYLRPIKNSSESKDRTAAVIYTVITPVINPLIYSLRNNDVKRAVKKLF